MDEVKVEERGWPGHFGRAHQCYFTRNTLLSYNGIDLVVSTIGDYYPDGLEGGMKPISRDSYYETMVFYAGKTEYKDSDTARGEIFTKRTLKDDDLAGNRMHEEVVTLFKERLLKNDLSRKRRK